jgi:PAS domain S-box-containing protein
LNNSQPRSTQTRATDDTVISLDALQSLRRRAEDSPRMRLALPQEIVKEMKPEDAQLLFHELRVHQIELEQQNEELRRVQVELELARERYFDLYDMAPVGYCTVNEQGLILEANLTAATLLGVPRSALVKRPINRFLVPEQRNSFQHCCEQLRASGETQCCELQLIRQDGATLWVSVTVNLAKCITGDSTLRVMFKDVSERVLQDAALRKKNVELESARHVAEKANGAKSEFLASMSHELRSPLNAILGFAQLMDASTPALTSKQKSSIDQILHGGWYLLGLVNEILDLSSIEAGRVSLAMAPQSLGDVLQDCQTLIEPIAASSGIHVSFPLFDEPCLVQADPRRLKQVVINLLSNAIKYNRPAGKVDVTWSLRAERRVRVSVQDGGLGLDADQLGQLFQPFSRLGQEAGTQEGTGIGLVVSKRLVELMGGSMGVHSTVGVGSVFWFELLLSGGKS